MQAWDVYVWIYVVITLVYLWYRFLLLFYVEMRRTDNRTLAYAGERITIIIPFYNEEPSLLHRTIAGVRAASGNNQIIVVDDGSPNGACAEMVRQDFPEVVFVRYAKNRGKRQAQQEGFRHADGLFVVTVDSDAVIEPEAFVHLIDPMLRDGRVGATTGNVKVLNKDENFLTKMIAARYWNAFSLERKALSSYGIVTCCSGALSAYRADLFRKFMEQYTTQTFLGVECTYGDDRHLTNLLLRDGWKIKFVDEAICQTAVPSTYRKFFKQQLRWKKSFLRESYVALTYSFRHSFLLTFEVLVNLLIPFLGLAIRVALIVSIIMHPILIIPFILSVATVALIRNYFLLLEDRKMAFYSIPYAFLHEFGLFWLYFVALFSLKEKSWGTR